MLQNSVINSISHIIILQFPNLLSQHKLGMNLQSKEVKGCCLWKEEKDQRMGKQAVFGFGGTKVELSSFLTQLLSERKWLVLSLLFCVESSLQFDINF